jgi:hypothetical protein
LLHIRCSSLEAARSEANVAKINDSADAMPSMEDGSTRGSSCTIVVLQLIPFLHVQGGMLFFALSLALQNMSHDDERKI